MAGEEFWGRFDVRAAVVAGYVGLIGLIVYPTPEGQTLTAAPAPVAKSATSTEAVTAATSDKAGSASSAATSAASAASPAQGDARPATSSAAQAEVQVAAAQAPVADAKPDPAAEAAITALAKITDYQRAKWHPLHFKPDIDKATNAECLACHKEILDAKVRDVSPAGVKAAQSIAWYQTLDTYEGAQESFHARHMTTPLAQKVMNLKCTFCHQGNDPREEAPHSSATAAPAAFTLRKMVDPSTCLRCHGSFPGHVMGFDTAKWPALRDGIETPDTPNGCLTCHAEQFRTVRHQVNYLHPAAIEEAAKTNTDLCFGCHGGRQWYRTSFPYPRHPWPGMDPAVPEWAKDRPVESLPEHLVGVTK